MDRQRLIAKLRSGHYGDSVPEIIDVAKAVERIDAELATSGRRTEWLEANGLHPDKWARLLLIARAKHLHEPTVATVLPSSFSTLALLSRCSDEEFREAFSQGLINPTLTHDALADWRRNKQVGSQANREPVVRLIPVVIGIAPEMEDIEELNAIVRLQEFLEKLENKTTLIHLASWDNVNEQAADKWQKARLEEARKEVEGLIKPAALPSLNQPIAKLKRECASLSEEQWSAVYTLKNAYDSVLGSNKHKRYASRTRLQTTAASGNELARRLAREILGLPESKTEKKRGPKHHRD